MYQTYSELFLALSHNVDELIQLVQEKKGSLMATDVWTVQEVFCHVVFWHENYAANYKALSENKTPPLLVGPGYKVNSDGVASLNNLPIDELIIRLQRANQSLYHSIVECHVSHMTYKKDSRDYTTEQFLDLVTRHIATHTKQVKRAK